MPLWIMGMFGFGLLFWLFVLLPSWLHPNAEVVEYNDENSWR